MNRKALLLILSLGVLPAGAFDWGSVDLTQAALGGQKLLKATVGISDAEEATLGREVAANLAARYGLTTDAAKEKYVSLVGQLLVRHCSRREIAYHFGILHTAEINALATPGGYIFITDGLLDTLQDESELAGVLAHEISHVTERHITKAIREANLVGASQDLAAVSGHDVSAYAPLSDFSINLLSHGLSRKDELDADQRGTLLAAEAGYDPAGLKRSIERLNDKKINSLYLSRFAKTHPDNADRVKAIDKTLSHHHLKSDGQRLESRFQTTFASK